MVEEAHHPVADGKLPKYLLKFIFANENLGWTD